MGKFDWENDDDIEILEASVPPDDDAEDEEDEDTDE